jgi:hypothetical protein
MSVRKITGTMFFKETDIPTIGVNETIGLGA